MSIRTNPKYSNICAVRIGMFRSAQCYYCVHLEECDSLYDSETGEFDYPRQEMKRTFGYPNKLVPIKGGVWDTS